MIAAAIVRANHFVVVILPSHTLRAAEMLQGPCASGFERNGRALSSFWETSGSAGGLAPCDSSGNGPIRGMVVRAGSPHPDPLPQGEGWGGERNHGTPQRGCPRLGVRPMPAGL